MSEYKIKKEVTEILADYKYNDTKVETTEQYADKIINKCLAEVEKMVDKEIEEWKYIYNKLLKNFGIKKDFVIMIGIKQHIEELKQKLKEMKK